MYFFQKSMTIFFGSILIGIGINFFLVPYELLDGGAIGIGLVLHYLLDMKLGLAILLISVPIFLFALVVYRPFFINGVHGMLFSSLVIEILHPLHIVGEKYMNVPLVSAMVGGVLVGSGIGLMLLFDTSIGGTDLLAQMFAKYIHVNPGILIFLVDLVVVTIGSTLIPSSQLLLSCITVTCVGITSSVIVAKKKRIKKLRRRLVNHANRQ